MTTNLFKTERTTTTRHDVLLVMPTDRRRSIMQCLKALGVAVKAVATFREARRVLKRNSPAPVVVTDVTLTDGNWCDLLRFVVDNDVRTSVLIAASDADECLWSEALWRGAHDLLVEPYKNDEVKRMLESALRSLLRPPNGRVARISFAT